MSAIMANQLIMETSSCWRGVGSFAPFVKMLTGEYNQKPWNVFLTSSLKL